MVDENAKGVVNLATSSTMAQQGYENIHLQKQTPIAPTSTEGNDTALPVSESTLRRSSRKAQAPESVKVQGSVKQHGTRPRRAVGTGRRGKKARSGIDATEAYLNMCKEQMGGTKVPNEDHGPDEVRGVCLCVSDTVENLVFSSGN